MSVAYEIGKAVTKEIDGTEVLFILQARLEEVSLVPSGAVKSTHAMINDIDNCGSLANDCKSMKFQYDNSYVELQRALQRAAS